MSTEENKKFLKWFTEELINNKKFDEFRKHVTPDAIEHAAPPGMPQNIDSTIQFFKMFGAAFPDFKYTIHDAIAEGDLVVQRTTCQGTMKGEMLGMKPSGKSATWAEIHIVRMKDGKIAEHWASVDQMGMLQQLGLAPAPGG